MSESEATIVDNGNGTPDTLPPPADLARAADVTGIVSLRELRHVVGLQADELAARMGVTVDAVEQLEALDVELLEVIHLIEYCRALGMALQISVDLLPRSPLTLLSTRR